MYGDANLDGTVNLADLSKVLPDWGKTNQTWAQGDFNYDGVVNLGDLTKVLENWGHQLNSSLTASSTFTVDLTDDGVDLPAYGPGTLVVTGAVRLNNATLEVTSSRTDTDYGILRVLIESDSGTPVIGTFNGLPEGAEVDVGGVRYYITYHFNAKTGEFGTGNDVALVSSPAFGVSSALLSSQTVTLDYASESHYLDATLVPRYTCSQFQLSTAVWTQQYPAWADATFSFTSEDSTIASVDPSTGLVTFLPQEEEEGSDCPTCRILVTATLAGQSPQTIEIRLTGASIEDTYYVPDTINGTDTSENNVGNYVLVLYNADSTGGDINNVISSTALMQYYRTYRLGMANATYLGISAAELEAAGYNIGGITSLPDTVGSSAANDSICQAIAGYVANWVKTQEQSNPSLAFRYIVGLCGLPSRDSDQVVYPPPNPPNSVPGYIYRAFSGGSTNLPYSGAEDRFSVAEYGAPLIAWLDCGSYAATVAFIMKERAVALNADGTPRGLEPDGITISGSQANVAGSEYYFDDVGQFSGSLAGFPIAVENAGISSSDVDYQQLQHIGIQPNPAVDPVAYFSEGTHGGLDGGYTDPTSDWANDGQINFTGKAGWWIGLSWESFNGIYPPSGYAWMANPATVFSATAFGGTNYSNTPVCWTGNTGEPGSPEFDADYVNRWARGWSSLEAAWAGCPLGCSADYLLVVTDVCLNL